MSDPTPVSEDAGRARARQRALLILLGIVGLLAVVFFVLTSGGDDPTDGIATTPVRSPRASPAGGVEPTASPRTLPPETDEAFEGRDPFEPVINGDDEEPDPGPDGGVTDGDDRVRVTLLDIFTDNGERLATVDVDGTQFTVTEGETFADNFRLLNLTSSCGTFVFGDERFTLCLGQEVLK